MGFHLVHGNDADALLAALAGRLRMPHPAAAPLAPEVVLVPQFGLRRWLEIRLAEKLGIVANVEFAAPAEYAWRLLRAANPGLAPASGYEREILRWRIFALLAPLARAPGFDALAAALGDGDQSTRLRFADALAHAYERDLAYRSDRLAAWERGAERGDWRAELWRRLVRASTQPHRAALLAAWLRKYGDGPVVPPGLPPRLSAFACANISPDLLRFYGAVARHAEVGFYLPNPCREYWGDVRSARQQLRDGEAFDSDAFADAENPALAAWGRAGRDLVERLFSYELVQPEAEDDRSREPRNATLLARVQRDVLDRLPPADARLRADGSIQFHRCHSRLREVQALHDRLLDLFAHDPTLTPRDVAVMSPEIGAYAPHIESVFGGIARDDARYLPFALSDCPVRETHPLIGVALRLVALPTSRLELAEIGEWLALPALQRRFGLDADEVTRLVGWLREAGVRWGLDAAQRAATGAGDYAEFSWRFGLERLLLGYASGAAGLIEGIAPDPAVEGTNANVLGAMLRIVDVLAALLRAQRHGHTPQQWQELYNDTFSQLFDAGDDRDAAQALERLRGALADFADETASAGVIDAIDWRCLRDELAARFAEPERAFRFFGGGITVCGMVPLRAVPFRVICLIGMNESAFPRRDRASPFDRAGERRVEPSIRDEDRYLFLQQLMAAGDAFHLSWVGENARDGSREEPSAVVAELLGILAQYGVDEENLVVDHPLQPFSPRLFDGNDARLFTYDDAWLGTSAAAHVAPPRFMDAPTPVADAGPLRLDWREWQRFWRNPAAAYFRHALGIELARAPQAHADADDLVLSRLGEYRAFDALFDAQENSDPAAQFEWLRASAALPAGAAGERAFSALRAPLSALAAKREEIAGMRAVVPPAPFELDFGELALDGLLPAHRDGLLVRALPGEAGGHRLLQAWLDFLLLATRRDDARLFVLEWKDGTPLVREARGVAHVQAQAWLRDLALLHARGRDAPLPFFPKSSYAYAQRRAKRGRGDDDDTAWTLAAFKVAQAAFTSDERHRGEDIDPAFALAARDISPFDPATREGRDFADCAQRVFAPLLATLKPPAAGADEAKTKAPKARAKPGKTE
ncbi:MAG: exodeoxyribonuclease V subunit gamma [Rudaea sp.]|uniref:exodeoxyribonuclease V subunit gamma n=1 Tax=Rudaea sp. TaxID=2136325 RepID=UPI0039E29661